jgi:hypothetical protein
MVDICEKWTFQTEQIEHQELLWQLNQLHQENLFYFELKKIIIEITYHIDYQQ